MRQKLCNSIDGMRADTREDIHEPGEGIDLGSLTGSHETAQHGGRPAADIATKEHPVTAPHSHTADCLLSTVVVDF